MAKQNEEMDNVIVLTDDDGKENEFEFVDLIEYNGGEYAVLFPVEETDEPTQIVILKVLEDEESDEALYVGVEDEKTLNEVYALFKETYKDEFNFTE